MGLLTFFRTCSRDGPSLNRFSMWLDVEEVTRISPPLETEQTRAAIVELLINLTVQMPDPLAEYGTDL
jgi:hypothetical protein